MYWLKLVLSSRLRLLALITGIVAAPLCIAEVSSEIRVYTHPSIEASDLSTTSLRAIFSLRKRSWDNDIPIKVYVLPDSHPLHRDFCKSLLKVYPYVLRDQWDRAIFSGVGTPPTVVKSLEALKQAVDSTPGAIGYSTANEQQKIAGNNRHEFAK